jgi:glc operon protein GlcG
MQRIIGTLLSTIVLVAAGAAHAQVVDKKALTLEAALQVTATAIGEARRLGAPGGVIAVVDDGGNLVSLERLDGTFAAGATISIGKARTAALFKKPTKVFEDLIRQGRTAMVALPDFTPLQGGVPLYVGEEIIGAIGVSGAASAAQDEQIAMAGAAAARTLRLGAAGAAVSRKVSYIDHAMVTRGFDKGAVLVNANNYMIHASHREQDGLAEIHTLDTDLVYVLEGSATLVTGGQTPDARVTEPNELRGTTIVGGESRPVAKGDVVVIPAGVPHMFTEVRGALNYYVVKVR